MSRNNEATIKNFAGLNVRDAADKVADNEFTLLQNVWQPTKGVYAKRFGTSIDVSSIPLASAISGVWRHYSPNQERISLYHCDPDTTVFPDNTDDLILEDVTSADGIIFGGGAVVDLRVCYSWIGCGIEQTYNSKSRTGFPDPLDFPVNAWDNPAHQKITLAAATNILRVTVPTFPTGVRGANIFVARGSDTQMTYVGTVATSGGSLDVSCFIGPNAASADSVGINQAYGFKDANGTLVPGLYYVAVAPVCDPDVLEQAYPATNVVNLTFIQTVTISGSQNAIRIVGMNADSPNGAQSCYVFVSTADIKSHPGICAGIINKKTPTPNNFDILSIPHHNAQSSPLLIDIKSSNPGSGGVTYAGEFRQQVNVGFIGGINSVVGEAFAGRYGFLMAKAAGGSLYEIFPSRTLLSQTLNYLRTTVCGGDSFDPVATYVDLHNFAPQIKTVNDTHKNIVDPDWVNPFVWPNSISAPQFAHHLGISYFVNGGDIPWQTDGHSLGQLGCVKTNSQTILPPIPRFIFEYQGSLVVAGSRCGNQVYGSNAFAPNNWVTGGTGSLLRFITVGDAVGSGVSATGIFTPSSDSPGAVNNPNSFMISFKKHGTWMVATITDPAAGTLAGQAAQVPASQVQVSGKIGCTAYRTICQTNIGTIFLGSDGNVYLIRSVSEPIKIGNKIRNFLTHLVSDDRYMRSCTAIFHDSHFKLSYPSPTNIAAGNIKNDYELWADLRTDEDSKIVWNGPHIGRNVGAQTLFSGDGDDFSRMVADSSSVRSLVPDDRSTLADIGSNIVSIIRSKIYRMGAEAHLKRVWGAILDMYIDFSYTNNVLFEAFADSDYESVNRQLSTGGATWDVSQWDQSNYSDADWEGFSFLFGSTNLNGRTLQFRVTHSNQAPFVLASVTPIVRAEKRRIVL